MSLELKRFLLNSYLTSAGERTPDVRMAYSFRVGVIERSDEKSKSCCIDVEVTGLDRFSLRLVNSPIDSEIDQLVRSKGGEISLTPSYSCITLTLDTANFHAILILSSLFRTFAARTHVQSDCDNMRIGERIADVLDRLAALISQYERQTQGMEKTRPDGLFAF